MEEGISASGHQKFDSEEQLAKMASKQLTDQDLEVCRSSLTLLNEMKEAATRLEDMQGEVPTEIVGACIKMRKQMAKIVEAKSMYGGMQTGENDDDTVMQITIYLEMIDLIDNCLKEYKATYLELHQAKILEIQSKQNEVKKKLRKSEKQKKKQSKLDDTSDSGEE